MAEAVDPVSRRPRFEAQVKAQAEAFIKAQPPEVQSAIASQQAVQIKRDELEGQYKAELEELARKYEAAYAPLYEERRTLLTQSRIPNFWATALHNLPAVSDLEVTEKDMEVLAHVTDITSELLPDGKGFSVTFHFENNPFLSNKTLTNTYHVHDMEGDNPELEKASGSEIEWKPGKSVTTKVLKKKPKNPNQRPLTKTEECESFFHFFNPPELPEDIDNVDDEELDMLEERLEACYVLGSAIRSHLIPKAVQWFTGEALATYGEEFMSDDDEEEEEASEELDSEEEEDDDSDVVSSGADESALPAGGAGAGNGEEKPECKQQ